MSLSGQTLSYTTSDEANIGTYVFKIQAVTSVSTYWSENNAMTQEYLTYTLLVDTCATTQDPVTWSTQMSLSDQTYLVGTGSFTLSDLNTVEHDSYFCDDS